MELAIDVRRSADLPLKQLTRKLIRTRGAQGYRY